MHSVLISLVVFGCTFGGALFGMFLHSILPKEHLQPGTTDVVKLATGLVVTMTGLVLGMLVSSSLTFYNTQHREIQDLSASDLSSRTVFSPNTVPRRKRYDPTCTMWSRLRQIASGLKTGHCELI